VLAWPSQAWRAGRAKFRHSLDQDVSPHRLALSFSIGAFISFTPWPGHTLLAVGLAMAFGLSPLPAAVGAWVNLVPIMPFTYAAAFKLGAWMTRTDVPPVDISRLADLAYVWSMIPDHASSILVGCFTLGAVVGSICYLPAKRTAMSLARLRNRKKAGERSEK